MPRGHDLYARWATEVRQKGFFRPGEKVGVAVSGGADSVLLLEFMRQLASGVGLVIAAVHFNHHLRGIESDEDENFVRDLAARAGIEFIRGEADVARAAREKRRNLEATARELRYRFFLSLVARGRLDKVLTAHTANDQAETVFLRLLRGTGTRGLGGIFPALDGKIFRPFLNLTRAEIESEMASRGLGYRTDSTNRDTRLRRNKVRMELFPWLREEFKVDIIPLLSELAERARDDNGYLEDQARERARAWRVREGSVEKIPVRPLMDFPPALARRVLRQMIFSMRASLQGVTHRHIEALYRLAGDAQSGRSVALPGGMLGRREFEWLWIGPTDGGMGTASFSYSLELPARVRLPQLGVSIGLKIVGQEEIGKAYNGTGERGLVDPLRLRAPLVLRNWREGDRFRPAGRRNISKLKELFRQRKIPLAQRKLWPVLECANEIVWVRGFPVGAPFAVSPTAQQAVEIIAEAEQAESPRTEQR